MRRLLAPPALALLAAVACASGPTPKQREAAEIHTNLGLEALRAGRPQDALREFEDALRNDDGLAEAHLGRGLVLELTFDRRDEAEKEYRRAIALKPRLSEAHNDLGQLLARRGKLAEAIEEFDTALSNMYYREPYSARYNKGRALAQLGRRDEALAELRTCLALNPRYCPCHGELGRLQLDAGKTQEALAAFQKYAHFCDREPDAFYQVGLAQLKAGNAEGAREAFQQCEQLAGVSDLGSECRRRRELLR
jgi:type IV pilus biogenesis/stability protein PilW